MGVWNAKADLRRVGYERSGIFRRWADPGGFEKGIRGGVARERDTERPTVPTKKCYRHVREYDAVLRAHVGMERVDGRVGLKAYAI
jgi:hypothetical protein